MNDENEVYENCVKYVFPVLPNKFTDDDIAQAVIDLRNDGGYDMFPEFKNPSIGMVTIELHRLYLYLCNEGFVKMFIRGNQIVYEKVYKKQEQL